jgi:predicted negative regulator of RcsB-dependent stress response
MKALVFVLVLLLVGIVGLGFYQGWFTLSVNNADHQPSATFTMDKDKIHEDEQKAKDKVQGVKQEAKEKIGDRADKVKEPERQP